MLRLTARFGLFVVVLVATLAAPLLALEAMAISLRLPD